MWFLHLLSSSCDENFCRVFEVIAPRANYVQKLSRFCSLLIDPTYFKGFIVPLVHLRDSLAGFVKKRKKERRREATREAAKRVNAGGSAWGTWREQRASNSTRGHARSSWLQFTTRWELGLRVGELSTTSEGSALLAPAPPGRACFTGHPVLTIGYTPTYRPRRISWRQFEVRSFCECTLLRGTRRRVSFRISRVSVAAAVYRAPPLSPLLSLQT